MTINYYTLRDIFQKEDNYSFVTWHDIHTEFKDWCDKYYAYLNVEDTTQILLAPLFNRWNSSHIALYQSEYELGFDGDDDKFWVMKPILDKLNLVLASKMPLVERYYELLEKDSFETVTNSSNTNSSRFNDTPTSQGDYSAKEYTTNITQGESKNTSSASTNEFETYDILLDRLRNISLEIINEMKEFETWI